MIKIEIFKKSVIDSLKNFKKFRTFFLFVENF